jgi:hypothetical protein
MKEQAFTLLFPGRADRLITNCGVSKNTVTTKIWTRFNKAIYLRPL